MDKKELTKIFQPIFKCYIDQFSNNLRALYPLDPGTNRTFNEANFTSNFLKALDLNDSSDGVATWDEFPVPKGTRRDEPNNGGEIDSLIVDHKTKRIFLLESKRLRKLNKKYPAETVADTPRKPWSLVSDMARAFQVANSNILPSRIWKEGRRFEPLGDEYNDYKVFGLALCGIWTTDRRYDAPEVVDAFVSGGEDLINQNQAFDVICLNDGVTLIEEIKGLFPEAVSKVWQFFTLLYAWEIERKPEHFCSFVYEPDIDAIKQDLSHYSIEVEEGSTWWYLFPSCFIGTHIKGTRTANKLWIYKSGDACKLFAYPQGIRTIRLPDGFAQDEIRSQYVSMLMRPDSIVEDIKRIFDEIIAFNS